MLKLTVAVIAIAVMFTSARSQATPADAQQIAKVKAAIAKIGTSPGTTVRITLRDGSKVKGFMKEIRDDDFDVITENGSYGNAVKIAYSDVVKVQGKGIDWKAGAGKTFLLSLKALGTFLRGACFGPISRCSP